LIVSTKLLNGDSGYYWDAHTTANTQLAIHFTSTQDTYPEWGTKEYEYHALQTPWYIHLVRV